jgi:hypothetical protein
MLRVLLVLLGFIAESLGANYVYSGGCPQDSIVMDILGDCSYENLLPAALEHGCTEEELFRFLGGVNDATEARVEVSKLCPTVPKADTSSFITFGEIFNSGYQFDRELMNGGTDLINEFNPDMSRISWVEDNILHKRGIAFPTNMYHFRDCYHQTAMCCWVADSSSAGNGTCSESAGCQDGEPENNSDICLVDVEKSRSSSHTASGFAIFPDDAEGNTNCMGYTWTKSSEDYNNIYKGNLLFEVAMRYGLKDNGYTRSVPHAPMCACVEQMPIVSNADCRDISKISHSFFLSSHKESGFRSITYDGTRIIFGDCDGKDLVTHYESVHSKSSSNPVKDGCADAESRFILGKGYVKQQDVKWVQVAGKGAHSDSTFSLQVHDGQTSHSSMTREEFEALWATSTKVLLRRCDTCDPLHRQIYYKRHDKDELPSNVDILHDLKENWTTYENNVWKQDFDLYSSYSNVIQDKNAWKAVDMSDSNSPTGCCANSGPISTTENQWNVWDTPRSEGGNKYGQRNIGLYVAISTGLDSFSPPTSSPTTSLSPSILPNVALLGTAEQSCTAFGGVASIVIDGDTVTNSISHTCYADKPWWKVVLDKEYSIHKIAVWNRIDCCKERLNEANLEIWRGDNIVKTKNLGDMSQKTFISFDYSDIIGDVVRVQLTDTDYLSLIEVEVFGVPV